MRQTRIHPFLFIIIGLAQLLLIAAEARAQYSLSWYTVDGGGVTSATGGRYSLGSTGGQPDASNTLTGGTYSFNGGFWPGVQPAPACTGDIALPHNGQVDTDDLLLVISGWGACSLPCPPNCIADIALPKNCAVDADDLLVIVGNWGACPP
jgi:hypothetical protein